MGVFAHKCLQNSVMALVRGHHEESRLRRMLFNTCRNDSPSGGADCGISQLNFYSVEYCLLRVNLCVSVVGATSMDRLEAGWVLGRWSIGQKDGCHIGAICWLIEDAHSAPLTDDFFTNLSVGVCANDIIPPWELWEVGAPKKKSQRGAHLNGRGKAGVVSEKVDAAVGTALGNSGVLVSVCAVFEKYWRNGWGLYSW